MRELFVVYMISIYFILMVFIRKHKLSDAVHITINLMPWPLMLVGALLLGICFIWAVVIEAIRDEINGIKIL